MYDPPSRRRVKAGPYARQNSRRARDGSATGFLRSHREGARQAALGSDAVRDSFAEGLLPTAGDYRTVMTAFQHRASRTDAAGPDGLRPSSISRRDLPDFVREIGRKIRSDEVPPNRTREIAFSRGLDRSPRIIEISNLENAVAERALLLTASPFVEPRFLNSSVGFRMPGIPCEEAIARAERTAFDTDRWVWIRQDFRDAFPSVPRGPLREQLRLQLRNGPLCDLVARLCEKPRSRRGIQMGGSLSPFLLNIFLHGRFDEWLIRELHGLPFIRYADDFLILCRSLDEAREVHAALERISLAIGMPLKFSADESIVDMQNSGGVAWLGYRLRKEERRIQATIADDAWESLETHLRLDWEEPCPPIQGIETVHGWLVQKAAAFSISEWPHIYRRLCRCMEEAGFDEPPREERLFYAWEQAHHRRWVSLRRETVLRMHSTGRAGRSACQRENSAAENGSPTERRLYDAPATRPRQRREVFRLFADGSRNRRKIGGWAYCIWSDGEEPFSWGSDSHPHASNNRMELTAVLEGLRSLPVGASVDVFTDSEFVYRGFNSAPDQAAKRWRGVSQARLWQSVLREIASRDVSFHKVVAHCGNARHDLVDAMAKQAVATYGARMVQWPPERAATSPP